MGTCSIECYGECQREVYVDDKCILHCSKNDYSKDWNSGLLSDFYNEFIDYTIEVVFKHRKLLDDKYSKDEITTYLKSDKFTNGAYNEALKKSIFIPSCIHFPTRDGRDTFDYLKILNLFGQIHFNYCEFYLSSLNLKDIECFFQDCKFHDRWTLYDYGVLENEDNVIYQTCEFKKSVSNYTPEKSTELARYKYSQFDYTCKFNENLKFDRVVFKNRLFNTEQNNFLDENSIIILEFNKCVFEQEFKLNQYTIDKFIIEDSEFKDRFEFQSNSVNDIKIQNSKFEKVSIFTNSKFIDIYISDSVFNENIDFKGSIFGKKNELTKIPTTFKSVIIYKSVNFRDTKFYYGLDIPDTKINDLSSFLNADLAVEYTPRDTFRRLKHEFDSIGNIIEANKFYALEMKKREYELKEAVTGGQFRFILEYFIFKIHAISSNHSQDWALALSWIVIIGLLYTIINFCGSNVCLNSINTPILIGSIFAVSIYNLVFCNESEYKQYTKYIYLFLLFVNYFTLTKDISLSCLADKINPFSIMTSKDPVTFGLLLFKITIAYLIYQFIVSVRQNTRRK
jgi:hypothetical protein